MTASLRTRILAALAPALLAAAPLLAPEAQAAPATDAEPALAAPGAPMRSDAQSTPRNLPIQFERQICSQGPTGTLRLPDGTVKRVMVTAGHCVHALQGDPFGPRVLVPTHSEGDIQIGTTDAYGSIPMEEAEQGADPAAVAQLTFDSHDWGIVRLDEGVPDSALATSVDYAGNAHGEPVLITGIRDYPDLAPGQFDTSVAGQPVCKDGTTTGRSCGVLLVRTSNGLWNWDLGYQQGDSGGVNFDPTTGEAVGVSSMTFGRLGRAQPIDVAFEEAYGIPDGQVNEHFTVTDSQAAHSEDLRTFGDDDAAAMAWLKENNPMPDFVAEHEANVDAARSDAAEYTGRVESEARQAVDAVGAGEDPSAAVDQLGRTVSEAGERAAHHAEVLPESAALAWLSQQQ